MQEKKLALITLVFCVLLSVAVMAVVFANEYTLEMQELKENVLYIEAGEDYKLPAPEAWFAGNLLLRKPAPVAVFLDGQVDSKTPGSYPVCYRAERWGKSVDFSCMVIVKDTKPPVITLKTEAGHTTLPGLPYTEEGFTAIDAADGDVTHLVQSREENGKVIYTVQDAAGNVAQAERTIKYDDDVPPVLTLKGSSTINLSVGEAFEDPGFTAMDNGVIDITSRVSVSCKDKYFPAGTYTITYKVEDDFGNQATATRTLKVNSVGNGRVIYLTFDDGPGQYTEQLLEILDKYNVKATFFVVTSNTYKHLLKKMDAAGHSIGLHTDSHDYWKIYKSEENYFEDLNKVKAFAYEQLGYHTNLLRFPGGSSNPISKKICTGIMTRLAQAVQEQDYRYFDWNVNTADAEGKSAETILENAISGCKRYKNSYVLMHDIMKRTLSKIEEFIVWALDNGYTFLPITDNTPVCHHKIQN